VLAHVLLVMVPVNPPIHLVITSLTPEYISNMAIMLVFCTNAIMLRDLVSRKWQIFFTSWKVTFMAEDEEITF
jgi:hypothetical protein